MPLSLHKTSQYCPQPKGCRAQAALPYTLLLFHVASQCPLCSHPAAQSRASPYAASAPCCFAVPLCSHPAAQSRASPYASRDESPNVSKLPSALHLRPRTAHALRAHYLEYNSTISISFTGTSICSLVGSSLTVPERAS